MTGAQLVCPTCAQEHGPDERFCDDCGMPLVHLPEGRGGLPAVSQRQETARKIKPEYAEGPLVKVASVNNLTQAEFIAGLLLEEGIPSILRGSTAGHGPLLGGRDILVPESGEQAAREALKWERPPEAR
jgi:hypothetical protein